MAVWQIVVPIPEILRVFGIIRVANIPASTAALAPHPLAHVQRPRRAFAPDNGYNSLPFGIHFRSTRAVNRVIGRQR